MEPATDSNTTPSRAGLDAVAPIHQQSIVDLAAAETCRLIFGGVYEPGERIYEERLAQQLGISRPPLREALRILTERGILEQIPRRGVRVTSLSTKDMEDIYSLRNALELFALDLTLPDLDPARLADVENALDEMWSAAHNQSVALVIEANRRFHIEIVALAGNDRLTKAYRGLMQQMQLYMSVNLRSEARATGDLLEACRRHERLLAAVRLGTREKIVSELAAHGASSYLSEVDDEDAR